LAIGVIFATTITLILLTILMVIADETVSSSFYFKRKKEDSISLKPPVKSFLTQRTRDPRKDHLGRVHFARPRPNRHWLF
jgi:hypothetical protein